MGRKPIAIDSAVLEIDSAVQAMGIGAESIVKEIRLRGQNHHPARLARPSMKCPACVVVFWLTTPQGCTVPLQLSFSRMALSKASGQDTLKRLWLGGQSGCVCAWRWAAACRSECLPPRQATHAARTASADCIK